MEKGKSSMRMWGYLPAASLHRVPLLQPARVPQHASQEEVGSVCSGGCGFALAITEMGKIAMWGATNDLGQSHCLGGTKEERLEPYLLDLNDRVVQAAGGWAHSVAVTDKGDVFTWGWSSCAPTASSIMEPRACLLPTSSGQDNEDGTHSDASCVWESECSIPSEMQKASKIGSASGAEFSQTTEPCEKAGKDPLSFSNEIQFPTCKLVGSKGSFRFDIIADSLQESMLDLGEAPSDDNTITISDNVIPLPRLVTLAAGVIITFVAAGGRHTLALSDTGKVWGWGHGDEGQLGLGSRVHMVSTPQRILDLETPLRTNSGSGNQEESLNVPAATLGTSATRIACGGRHSAVLTEVLCYMTCEQLPVFCTLPKFRNQRQILIKNGDDVFVKADSGAVLAFGWGLYGQCGQGSTEDQLSPAYVSALGGIRVTGLSAGLWHTMFITDEGDVYSTGGNQFGQLGTLSDQAEMLPTLVDAPILENVTAISVSCGARHTAILADQGKIFCWGWNKYGQLGTGDTVDRDAPVEIPLDKAVSKSVACGWWHTLALVDEFDL